VGGSVKGEEMTQTLYAHMKKPNKKKKLLELLAQFFF
jgi:hypothetical protein